LTADEGQPLPPARVKELIDSGEAELLDVRKQHEWEAGHIAGAEHVELNELQAKADELGKDHPFVVYCRGGNRSGMAAEALRGAGFDVHSMAGGISAWVEAGEPIEPEDGHVAESGEAAEILHERGRYVPFPEAAE
jgi:rhodanese-related sulfurtransferase